MAMSKKQFIQRKEGQIEHQRKMIRWLSTEIERLSCKKVKTTNDYKRVGMYTIDRANRQSKIKKYLQELKQK